MLIGRKFDRASNSHIKIYYRVLSKSCIFYYEKLNYTKLDSATLLKFNYSNGQIFSND